MLFRTLILMFITASMINSANAQSNIDFCDEFDGLSNALSPDDADKMKHLLTNPQVTAQTIVVLEAPQDRIDSMNELNLPQLENGEASRSVARKFGILKEQLTNHFYYYDILKQLRLVDTLNFSFASSSKRVVTDATYEQICEMTKVKGVTAISLDNFTISN